MTARLDRVNRFLEGSVRRKKLIASPEGIELEVEIANKGERLTAFCLDFLFWSLATLLVYILLAVMLLQKVSFLMALTVATFLAFLLRNFYFIYFEYRTNGTTPGKRIAGLRVIDRRGGPLTAGAIVARNLTREVEIFLPMGMFFALLAAGTPHGFWTNAAYFWWILLVTALPIFNQDHLRAGDIIAGTLVIAVPRRQLAAELVEGEVGYIFTRQQLESYGAFELQILEELLRRPDSSETRKLWRDVARKIGKKIGWSERVSPEATGEFLRAFYTAERAHLEREQLFGHYKEDKGA